MQKREKYREDIKGIVRRRMGGMAKITIVTKAYNPGKYIYQCVDSILNQTFTDFEYVIIDNASSDGTKEVLEEYARKDSRISLYRNEENNVGTLDAIEKYVNTEYFMVLDHDDYVAPNALEIFYTMAVENDLDMVFGRCMMVDAEGNFLAKAGMKEDMPCIKGTDLHLCFDSIYWQMRTFWGKLIRKSMVEFVDRETLWKRGASKYAGDTVIIMSMAFAAKKLGVSGEVLQYYRVLEKSERTLYCRQRFLADWMVYDMARDLLEKQDGLSLVNQIFLFQVYRNAVRDSLQVFLSAEVPDQEKIEAITEIVEHKHTAEMCMVLSKEDEKVYTEFVEMFGQAIMGLYLKNAAITECKTLMKRWLQLLYGAATLPETEFDFLYEQRKAIMLLLCLGNANHAYVEIDKVQCGRICPNLFFSLALRFEKDAKKMALVLWNVGQAIPEVYKSEKGKKTLRFLVNQNEILRAIEPAVLEETPELVVTVCGTLYEEAANLCFEMLAKEVWQRNGGVLELALTLVAILGDAGAFVMLKKCSCEFYINERKMEEAKAVLVDLEEMCPEDEEVKALKEALS